MPCQVRQTASASCHLRKKNFLIFNKQFLVELSCINDQLLLFNGKLLLQSWCFELPIIFKLVLKVFQVDLLAWGWWLAAEHPQTAAEGANSNQSHHRKNCHTSGEWQAVELWAESLLSLREKQYRGTASENLRNTCNQCLAWIQILLTGYEQVFIR